MRRSTIDRQREKTRPQCQTFCGQMRDVYPPKNPPEIPSKCSYPPLSVAKMVFASHRLFLWFVLLLWLLFPHFFYENINRAANYTVLFLFSCSKLVGK